MLLIPIACVNHIASALNALKQLPDLIRRRLPVVVQTDHDLPVRTPQSRHQRRVLSKIFRQTDAGNAAVARAQIFDHFISIIWRTVIYQNDFAGVLRHGRHCALYFCHHALDGPRTPVAGNDKTYLTHSPPALL